MIRSTGIESNVPIGANPPEEKSDTPFISYFLFILVAPVINGKNRLLLDSLKLAFGLSVSEGKVHLTIGEHFKEIAPTCQGNFIRIDQ